MKHSGRAQFEEPVVIIGFGPHGQALATLLAQPLASLPAAQDRSYLGFDLDPLRVQVRGRARVRGKEDCGRQGGGEHAGSLRCRVVVTLKRT
jgi:hypothetical protein